MSYPSRPPFVGPRLKVQRAKRHIDELQSELSAFSERKPYRLVVEKSTEPASNAYVLRVREEVPETFPLILGDVIHNLRASLDLLACELVRSGGGSDDRVQFPFSWDADSLEDAIKNRDIDRAGPDVVQRIRDLKPYKKEGNVLLRAIHDLDITDKHKLILPVGHAAGIKKLWIHGMGALFDGNLGPAYDGHELIVFPVSNPLPLGHEVEVAPQIFFGPGPLEARPVIEGLYELTKLVEGIIESFASP